MTPERWQQIDRLFQSALEHEVAERVAFLDTVCGSDEELRREVESLLAAHEKAASFIEAPPDDVVAGMIAEERNRLAIVYVGLGEKDEALTWLNKAYHERSESLFHYKDAPILDNLRADPRFTDLLRRMNLTS